MVSTSKSQTLDMTIEPSVVTQLFSPLHFLLKITNLMLRLRGQSAGFTNLLAHVLPVFLVHIAWPLPQFTNLKNGDDNNTSASSSVIRIKLVSKCLVLIIVSTH